MNYLEDVIIPESPRVLSKEQLQVYIPIAGTQTKGVASFYDEHFLILDGQVKINRTYLRSLFDEYSKFEAYLTSTKSYAESAGTHSANASTYAQNAGRYSSDALGYSRISEGYANGTVDGVDNIVYQGKSSKYWSSKSEEYATNSRNSSLSSSKYSSDSQSYSLAAKNCADSAKTNAELSVIKANESKLNAQSAKNDAELAKSFANLKLSILEDSDIYRYVFKLITGDGTVLSDAEIDLPLESSLIRIDDKIITNAAGEEELGLRFHLQNGDIVPSEHDEKYPEGYYPVSKILTGIVNTVIPEDTNYYHVYGQNGSLQELKAVTLYGLKADKVTPNANTIPMRGSRGELYTVLMPESDYEVVSKRYVDTLGYVKYTDYATSDKGGVVKVNQTYGTRMVNGVLDLMPAQNNLIDRRIPNEYPLYQVSDYSRHIIVPANVDYAVKKALADNKLVDTTYAWTDEEKASARALLGIDTLIGDIGTALDELHDYAQSFVGGNAQ